MARRFALRGEIEVLRDLLQARPCLRPWGVTEQDSMSTTKEWCIIYKANICWFEVGLIQVNGNNTVIH